MARKSIGHVKAVVRISAGEAERELYRRTYGRTLTSHGLSDYLKRLWKDELAFMRSEIEREEREERKREEPPDPDPNNGRERGAKP